MEPQTESSKAPTPSLPKPWDSTKRKEIQNLLAAIKQVHADMRAGRESYWANNQSYVEPWTWDRRVEDQTKNEQMTLRIMNRVLSDLEGYDRALQEVLGALSDALACTSIEYEKSKEIQARALIDRYRVT